MAKASANVNVATRANLSKSAESVANGGTLVPSLQEYAMKDARAAVGEFKNRLTLYTNLVRDYGDQPEILQMYPGILEGKLIEASIEAAILPGKDREKWEDYHRTYYRSLKNNTISVAKRVITAVIGSDSGKVKALGQTKTLEILEGPGTLPEKIAKLPARKTRSKGGSHEKDSATKAAPGGVRESAIQIKIFDGGKELAKKDAYMSIMFLLDHVSLGAMPSILRKMEKVLKANGIKEHADLGECIGGALVQYAKMHGKEEQEPTAEEQGSKLGDGFVETLKQMQGAMERDGTNG